jgi:hypothetical protein
LIALSVIRGTGVKPKEFWRIKKVELLRTLLRWGSCGPRASRVKKVQRANDVQAMLWDSPDMLWFSRNVETRGREKVAARFKEYYDGTWHLEPDMSQFHFASISNDVMQILVPIVFTRGLPGKPAQDNTFLISQTFVHEADGWHIASILPVANTQLK